MYKILLKFRPKDTRVPYKFVVTSNVIWFFSCIRYHSMNIAQKFRYTYFFLQMAYNQKISLTLCSNRIARRLGTSDY